MAELRIVVRDAAGVERWEYLACPSATIEWVWEGDGPLGWSYEMPAGGDRLPPRQARVEVYDPVYGRIWQGVLLGRNPVRLPDCGGATQLRADGDRVRMRWRRFEQSTVYGPVWEGTSLARTPEDAIMHAFGQLGAGIEWSPGNLAETGFTLQETDEFAARSLRDVVEAMSAVAAGLATPFVWSVRGGVFAWRTLDLAPRYQVALASGAEVEASDDASRLYSRVLVRWGRNQLVAYPDTASTAQLPERVDLVVAAGHEVRDVATAQRIAEALYARLQYIELGWSLRIRVPASVLVEQLGAGSVPAYLVPPQSVVRIMDLNWAERFGPHHPCPDAMLVTGVRYDASSGDTTITCGEWRDPTAVVRQVVYGETTRVAMAPHRREISRPVDDGGKIRRMAPTLSTAPSSTGGTRGGTTPPAIDHQLPPVSTKHQQILPRALPPMPIKVEQVLESATGFTTGLLDTGRVRSPVPPCEVEHVVLSCSPQGSLTLNLYQAGKTAGGAYVTDSSGDLVKNQLVLTASISGSKFTETRFSSSTRPRIEDDAILLYELTQASGITSWRLTLTGNRIVPGHPSTGRFNVVPSLGTRST